MRYALAVAIGLTFAWCGDQPMAGDVSSFRRLEGREMPGGDPRFRVFHDDERMVTCWAAPAAGIACLPDGAFANGGYR